MNEQINEMEEKVVEGEEEIIDETATGKLIKVEGRDGRTGE